MKFDHLIEHLQINIYFLKNHEENDGRKVVSDRFLLFKKALYQVKASGLQLDFNIFRQPLNQHTAETNCLKLYIIDPEIWSILNFLTRVWEQFLQHILCMIFQQKCSSCYVLLTDQTSLSGCYYFLRYVLQLLVIQAVTSWILKLT